MLFSRPKSRCLLIHFPLIELIGREITYLKMLSNFFGIHFLWWRRACYKVYCTYRDAYIDVNARSVCCRPIAKSSPASWMACLRYYWFTISFQGNLNQFPFLLFRLLNWTILGLRYYITSSIMEKKQNNISWRLTSILMSTNSIKPSL
jgi:hypothetical protein